MSTVLAQIGAFLAERLTAIQEQFSSYVLATTFNSLKSTVSSHTSSISSLSSSKLSTNQAYAGTDNLISIPVIKNSSTYTSSSYVQPSSTTQGSYAVSWTFTGPSSTYDSTSTAKSGVILIAATFFKNASAQFTPRLYSSSQSGSGNARRYLWVSFFIDGWTKSFPPVNLISLGGPSTSDVWRWEWKPTQSAYLFKSGFIQVTDSTRRYFWGFSTGSYTSMLLCRCQLQCLANIPNPHAETVTIYRPMVSIGTALADWAPAAIDQFC